MADYPPDLRYTPEHEWILDGGAGARLRIGVTDFAQAQLGDIVYVTLPEVGSSVQAGVPCGELESTKSVSDVYAPVDGTVIARNEALDTNPDLVNSDPYGEGWMFEVEPTDQNAADGLLDVDAYRALAGEG